MTITKKMKSKITKPKKTDGERRRLAVGYVGEDGIKPLTRYRCDAGKFVEIGPWVAGGAK